MTSQENGMILMLATKELAPDRFLAIFRGGVDQGVVSVLLREALASEESDDVECALLAGFVFGFVVADIDILLELLAKPWHYRHEDIVSALADFSTPQTVDGLYRATQWVPDYLSYDEGRALAVKAIWALGQIDDERASIALDKLALDAHTGIASAAVEQINRRKGAATD